MKLKNIEISNSLNTHLIPGALMDGDYDDVYDIFLEDRARLIFDLIVARVFDVRQAWIKELGGEIDVAAAVTNAGDQGSLI
jgi:hypothetical protein